LVCQGVRLALEEETTSVSVSKPYEPANRASGEATTTRLVRIPGQVDVVVSGNAVRVNPTPILRRSIPVKTPKDGWYPLTDVMIDNDQIAGRFSLTFIQKPTVRIDRHTGGIRMSGFGMDYNGSCEKSATPITAQKF
jgi:hypothetical protein